MNRVVQNTAVAVVGIIALMAAITPLHLSFVKPWMRWPLAVSGILLLALAVHGTYQNARYGHADDAHAVDPHGAEHGHDHGHGPRVGWLLVVPFLLLGMVTPPPLGAYSASRDSGQVATSAARGDDEFDALPDGTPEMMLQEYALRSFYDAETMEGREVALVGFASRLPDGDGWALSRMMMSCCAGDAQAVKVRVRGSQVPPDNQWLQVRGRFVAPEQPPEEVGALPIVEVVEATRIETPENPYE